MMSTLEANLVMSSTFLESPEITPCSLRAVSCPKTSGTLSGLRTMIVTLYPLSTADLQNSAPVWPVAPTTPTRTTFLGIICRSILLASGQWGGCEIQC